MKMKRTKASYIMQDGIAYHEIKYLSDLLRGKKFSILIDETTDVSVSQILAIVVRYHDNGKVFDELLVVAEVDDGTAEGLHKIVIETLQKMNIPLNNVIGFRADNCSAMMGSRSGFQARPKND